MKTEKTKLYKIYFFNPLFGKYFALSGVYSISSIVFDFLLLCGFNFFKIPFFGYHSPQFTALDPRGLAVYEKPEV